MKSKKIIAIVIIVLIATVASTVATVLNINKNKSKGTNGNNESDANAINENEEEIISVLKDMDTFLNNYKVEANIDELSLMKKMMFLFTTGMEPRVRTLKEYVSQIYEVRETTNNDITTYYIDAELIDKDDVLLKKRIIIKFSNAEIVGVNLNLGDINALSNNFSDGDSLAALMMLKYVYNDTFNSVAEQINNEWQKATIIKNVNYQKIWDNLFGVDKDE